MEDETIRLLINKIQNGLPDIKTRSIATLYTKVTLGIIDHNHLPRYINLPGVLLQWINDNKTRNQSLFKVLTIFNFFIKSEQGLLLLKQYEAKDFFEEYKQFLLGQQPRHDQYTDLLENIIKQLLPLASQQQQRPKPSPPVSTKEQKPKPRQKQVNKKEGIRISWIVIRDQLQKKEQDQLYSLMMELRHSKKQLQLQWLKKIQTLVKYWGYKWIRFRIQLINQLTDQLSKNTLKWLIIDILKVLIRGIGQSSKSLANEELLLMNLSGNSKLIHQPQTQKLSITLKPEVFESIYSFQLLEELIKYSKYAKESNLFQNLVEMNFKYSPKYFLTSLSFLLKQKPSSIGLDALTKNIEYYSQNYQYFPQKIFQILNEAPQEWNLKPQKFSILRSYMQKAQKNSSFGYISMYKSEWNLGSNLHNLTQVMGNLQKGVQAIDQQNAKHYIGLYLNSLLTLAVAVERQDPLMTYYPLMKTLVIKIAQKPSLRPILFQEIFQSVNSTSPVKYGNKNFSEADLAILTFSQESMFKQMFFECFGDDVSLKNWLQVTVTLGKKIRQFCQLSSYACIFHSLTYHKNDKIKNTAKILIQGLNKKGKQMIAVCRLFSRSEQQRLKIAKELFGENYQNVLNQLQSKIQKVKVNKKLLKISENSIQNYMQIIFNNNIEQEIRLNAGKELLQSLQRIDLNKNIQDLLSLLSDNICKSLHQTTNFSLSFVSLFIQINGVLNSILQEKNYVKIQNTIQLLQCPLPAKAIQVLIQHLYTTSFQSPFTLDKQTHFSSLLYPHLSFSDLKVGGYIQNQSQPITKSIHPKKKILNNYQNIQEFNQLIEFLMSSHLNQLTTKLDQSFVNIVQKQIGCILHASKGYIDLYYLAYGFNFIGNQGITLPDKIFDYSSPLLNSLLAKDQSPDNCEPIASIISIIGCKKSRQLNALLSANPQGLWKYSILLKMETIQTSLMDIIIKGLLGISNGKQAVLILRLVLAQAKKMTFSTLSQTLIITNCIKLIRQDADQLLRKTAICVITQLYKSTNLSSQGWKDIFSSAISIVLEQTLTLNISRLMLNLIKTILQRNQEALNQTNILKIFIGKIATLLSIQSLDSLTAALIFQIVNIVGSKKRSLLSGIQLVDASIIFIGNAIEKKSFQDDSVRLVTQILDYLFIQCHADTNLSKYLLTSTNILKIILNICKLPLITSTYLLQSIGRTLIKLTQDEQDLFIYKVNLFVKTQIKPFINILATHLPNAGLDYLKMIGWIMVIWQRNREELEPTVGHNIGEAVLNSQQPNLIKSIMPFSIKSKVLFLSSKYLQRLLKQNSSIIDERLVRQSKDKKKKIKLYQLGQKQFTSLNQFLSLLSSFFYWSESVSSEEQIKQNQGLKKILIFIEKMYSCGQWDDYITKSYLKVITNMALSQPFAIICSNRLSQNAIMVEEIIGCVSKSQNSEGMVKLSLKLMSLLVHFESIRSAVLRARVIEELSLRLIKGEQRGDLNLQYILDIIELFLSFSSYKDSNIRLLNDKKVLEVLLRIIKLGKFSVLEEKIVLLLSNLACFKSNKSTFMSNRQIHKIILGLLEDSQISYHSAILSLLYNILYKNSAGLKLYRRPQVIQVIKNAVANNQNDVSKALMQALISQQSIG